MLLKRYSTLVKMFKLSNQNFHDFAYQVQKKERIETAVFTIQKFFRRYKQRKADREKLRKNLVNIL